MHPLLGVGNRNSMKSSAPTSGRSAPPPRWRSALAMAVGLLVGACAGPRDAAEVESASQSPAPRHVILLTVDTLRADHTSLHGYPRATTPFLQRLATSSTVFDHAIVQWPKTGTSFASMFTGRYPESTGLTHKAALRIPEELPTLPESFRGRGFRTVAVVSNAVLSKELGWDRGFDEYVETWAGSQTEDPVEYRALLHAGRVNRLAFELLDRHRDAERLFLWVHYSDPHAPYILPPERDNPFLGDELFEQAEPTHVDLEGTSGKAIGDATDLRFYRAQYDANVLEVDRALEAMVAELERRGLWADALAVITADHGESLGEHDLYFEHGPLPYNPSARVPLLVHGGGAPAGLRVGEAVELLGLAATLQRAVPRLQLDGAMLREGRAWPLHPDPSSSPDVSGAAARVEAEPPLAFAGAGRGGRRHFRSVQDAVWKLVFTPPRDAARSRPDDFELYDLKADPLEEQDVLDAHPDQVRRLRAPLLAWMERTAAVAPAATDDDEASDPEALRALRAMGYVQ
ncbi:MAG: hypothetical protein DWQ36_12395 [Acidobacteria bacterium]|nr:MAG: hypothetical protein DWQ36_12395 [Acidobacteriota bacterium]